MSVKESPSPKQMKAYLEDRGKVCPCCGSIEINSGVLIQECDVITQQMWCDDCIAEWTDVFILTSMRAFDGGPITDAKGELK